MNSKEYKQALKELFERYKMEEEDNRHIDKDGFCKHCRWNSCFEESHIRFATFGNPCEYIKNRYCVIIDEDGEITFSEK